MFATELEAAGIPRDLDAIPAGLRLAAVLSSIDVESISGRAAILFARAQQRQISHDHARQYRALSRVGDLYAGESPEMAEFASAEVGAGLTLTRRTSDREMAVAFDLAHRYPVLLEALETGLIDVPKVRTILAGVSHVDEDTAQSAIEGILGQASNLTTGQIAASLRKLVIAVDPDQAKKRYLQGVDARMVWSELAPDGTGTMIATGLPAHDLSAANCNINGIARGLKNRGDQRTIDQIRADVFAGLLTGAISSEAGKAQVNLTADLTTLAGLDDHPGDLAGLGPVVADIARQVAEQQADATWTYTITDPDTGDVFTGTTRRRPSSEQKRMVLARYPTCIHPGCRMPSVQCDIDHTKDWAVGGATTLCNLAPLCRYHHRLKHQTAWTYRRQPDGTIQWISQFGLTYITHPP
ncbi:MAG TPA: DUF222 domain-containing protein [Acidimicrobiia bacterium]|nr:DUF222 domain-containing protein [Acidimicrobiia bacterium]